MRRLKKSKRGLTFSVDPGQAEIGSHYRYVVDKAKKEVLIIPDEKGKMTVSRKRSGKGFKPLYDIRSKEVKELVAKADYLELEVGEERIIVHTFVKAKVQRSKIVSIEEFLGRKTGEIVLKAAVGAEFQQMTLADVFGSDSWADPPDVKEIQKVYQTVSLFSGAGLLDYAFRDPRIRFVYGVDFDEDACMTYRANIGDHIKCQDIRTVNAEDIPDADLVIGGPCCQGYSNANRHNLESSVAQEKRLLIDDYIRLVKAKQPSVFVIENVPQLFTKDDGIYIAKVLDGLPEYEITCTTVHDDRVGGYTKRQRAIVIGSKIGKIILPSETVHTVKTVKDALSKVNATWFNYADVTTPRASTQLAMSYVPQGGNWRDIPPSVHKFGPHTQSNIYRRLAWNEVSPTITNWRKCILTHPEENRILTVSEAAALMGLDKSFKVIGRTLNSKQQMIGNGVTQAIGKFVKKYVLEALDQFFLPEPAMI